MYINSHTEVTTCVYCNLRSSGEGLWHPQEGRVRYTTTVRLTSKEFRYTTTVRLSKQKVRYTTTVRLTSKKSGTQRL